MPQPKRRPAPRPDPSDTPPDQTPPALDADAARSLLESLERLNDPEVMDRLLRDVPIEIGVIAPSRAPWRDDAMRAIAALAPEEHAYHLLPTAAIPPSTPDLSGAALDRVQDLVEAFDAMNGYLVLVDDGDISEVISALSWATYYPEDRLIDGYPLAVIGVAGQDDPLGGAIAVVRSLADLGGSDLVVPGPDRSVGPWQDPFIGGGQLADTVPIRALREAQRLLVEEIRSGFD